jgi:hypothetical protein
MKRYKLLIIPLLAMAAALSWGAGQTLAASQEPAQAPPTNGTSSTGDFRAAENVPKLRGTTNAQRMDAARRLAERRAAAKRDAAANTTATPVMVSPQDMNGGAK